MKTWAVIPVKPAEGAKSRLAGALDAPAREALVRAMLERVHSAAKACPDIDAVSLIGVTRNGLPPDVELLADPGSGLNSAMAAVLDCAGERGVDRLIVIHGDLPGVTARDLSGLAGIPAATVGIAPDRHRSGTNALSLPVPHAGAFRFAFGPDSYALHSAECDRLGLRHVEIFTPGLSRDVDDPADLDDAAELLSAIRA